MSWGLGLNCCWDTGMHFQGWLHSGVSVALTAVTLPWRAGAEESHCRHSTAHFNVMWTSVITVQSGSQPSHHCQDKPEIQQCPQHLCATDVISGLTLSSASTPCFVPTVACSWSSINLGQHQCPRFGQSWCECRGSSECAERGHCCQQSCL